MTSGKFWQLRNLDRTYMDDFNLNVAPYLGEYLGAIYYSEYNAWLIQPIYE